MGRIILEIIQDIFNNREIAIGIWTIIAVVILLFMKPMQKFIKPFFSILFCRKFVVFYIVFLSYFTAIIYLLYYTGFWDIQLLKVTIFWILFVEFPMFANTIEKAKDHHFFVKLIKKNLSFIIIVEFILKFWTFSLATELIIVPIVVFLALLLALSSSKKKYRNVKRLVNGIYMIFGISIIFNVVSKLMNYPMNLLSISSLKELLLPVMLLFLNLPIVYWLALYKTYEEVFIRLKGNKTEQRRMKSTLFCFAGIILSKITSVRNNLMQTTIISLNNSQLRMNLKKLEEKLSYKIGENYMKRSHYYIIISVFGLIASITGIAISNSHVQIKDIFSLNFTVDIRRVKEIVTYICSAGVAAFVSLLIFSLGYKKIRLESIANVKRYVLYDLMYLIKKQHEMLQEFVPIDSPKDLFVQYVSISYEMKVICDKDIARYENLLTSWELESITSLQLSLYEFMCNIGINSENIENITIDRFCDFFEEKRIKAPQNEKINTYLYNVEKSAEKYGEKIKSCYEDFKQLID